MRGRLVLAIAGVATVAVILFAVPLAIALQRSYRDEAILRLERDTMAATRQIDVGAGGVDPIELPRTGDRIAIYDPAGRRVAGAGPARADGLVSQALRSGRPTDAVRDGQLLAAVPLLVGERVAGAIRAQRPASAADHDTHRAWLLLAALGAILVALSVLAAFLLARRLARPIERLVADARRLGDGDFTVRSPRSGVAELDELGTALDGTARRLDELVARERAFSADASHQLRTPLQALRLELEVMGMSTAPPAELPAAMAEVDRLQATVQTLLDAARDDPHREAASDLAAVLDAAEARWRGRLAAAGRPLRTSLHAGTPPARIAPAVLDQVLDVLLDNAERHGAGMVTVTVREASGALAIDVADEGPGFSGDPEAAFARRAGGGGEAGHGIGLALARSLVEAEGGALVVTRPGPGPVLSVLIGRVG